MTTNPARESDRFTIRWDDSMGCYRVSIPNYEGGEVVSAEAHEAEVQRLRSALNAVHNILRAEPPGGLPFGVRLTLESLARFALDAPSSSSDAPVSGFGGSQEAGT